MSDLPDYMDLEESDVIPCPICNGVTTVHNKPFRSEQTVISHIVASKGPHSGVGYTQARALVEQGKPVDEAELEPPVEAELEPQDEPPDERGLPNPEGEPPYESSDEPSDESLIDVSCCDTPEIKDIPTGSEFKIKSGDTILTENGDTFCKNCKAIIEADGNVIR